MEFLLVGGHRTAGADPAANGHRVESGLIVRVDPEAGTHEVVVRYRSPRELMPESAPYCGFHVASYMGDLLLACTPVEVLAFRLPDFEITHRVTLPCFNDVHHVCPAPGGNLLVLSTGLDLAVEVTLEGQVVNEWSLTGESTWKKFSRDVDYRKVPSTKPHATHGNFVFYLNGRPWVTRFHQRDAICLTDPGSRIDIGIQRPHDGVVADGRIWFTTVDGHVVVVDANTLQKSLVVDLNGSSAGVRPLGWARGLWPLDGERVVVGFSRFRLTTQIENHDWVKGGLEMIKAACRQPAKIALYDLRKRSQEWEFDTDRVGLSLIFAVLPAHRSLSKRG